jgi:hypothetical protein
VTEEAGCNAGRQRTIGDANRGTAGSRGAQDSEGSAGVPILRRHERDRGLLCPADLL